MRQGWIQYARTCFWLIVPILLLNASLMRRLPRAYQMDVFWRDIPRWLRMAEHISRMVVFMLPILMPLRIETSRQRMGLVLYLLGNY